MALRLTLAALAALSVALTIHGAGEGAIDETEIWNEGVELYRAGDYTNAHAKLKPLMLSRDYGARASELVAAIDYAFATSPLASQDGEKASSALEEAAQGAQIALRANPKDERLRRNFDRTIHDLPELRRTRKINAILQASASSSPDAILRAMRDSARSILEKSASYKTNSAHSAIAIADSLQAKCEKIADDWIAVKEGIARAVTNEEEIATISARLDDVRERTMAAAKSLGDFGDDAYGLVAATETDANKF